MRGAWASCGHISPSTWSKTPHAGEPGQKGKPQGRYMLDHERIVHWAFIAWEPKGGGTA